MTRRSILAGHKARLLLKKLPASKTSGPLVVIETARKATLHARYCGRWCHGVFEFTGGVYLKVSLPRPIYGCCCWTASRRLRPGWTDHQFIAAAQGLLHKAWDERYRQEAVEQCYKKIDGKATDMTGEEIDKLAEDEDVQHWLRVLGDQC